MEYFVHEFSPHIFKFGFIQVRWYGLMYVLGFFIGYLIFVRRWNRGRFYLSPEQSQFLLTFLIVGMVIGARVAYVLVYDFWNYAQHPLQVFAIWKGGLSYHGAAIGFIVSCILVSKKLKVGFYHIMDSVVIASAFGVFLGRIGNFINGELVGRVTDVPWAVIFPSVDGLPRHPSQIYQSLTEGLLTFFILLLIERREAKKGFAPGFNLKDKTNSTNGWKRTGVLATSYLIIYGVMRFIIEFFRMPDSQLGFFAKYFSMGQIFCFLMIVIGIILLVRRIKFPIKESPS